MLYHPFLVTMRFKKNDDIGYRYDPIAMLPVNSAARDIQLILDDHLSVIEPIVFDWCKYSALVIDNWMTLHGRGAAPRMESARTLSRIYVV